MDPNFNWYIEQLIKELGRNEYKTCTKQKVIDAKDKIFAEANLRGPDIVLKSKLDRKLNKAETAEEAMTIISESWSV